MHKYSMTASEMESDKKCKLSGWSAFALILWCIAIMCGLIGVVTNSDSQGEFWFAWIPLVTMLSAAFGVLLLAIDPISDNMHAKNPRALLVVFMLSLFVIFSVWTWMLSNNISTVYGHLKFSGTLLAGLFGFIFVAVIIQKYTGEHKSINKFFQLVDKFDRISFWKKWMYVIMMGLAGAFVLEVSTWEVLILLVSWWPLTNPNITINSILTMIQVINLISGISPFLKRIVSQINNGSKTKESPDEPITREQLLKKLNIIAADLKYVRNAVEHMK